MTSEPSPAHPPAESPPTALRSSLLVVGACAVFMVGLHALAITSYGYFRDELYYIASTRHLDFGYVDHPPFSIILLAAWTQIFGDSLIAVRAPSILAGASLVVVTGLSVRAMGGRLFAQGLAAAAVAVTPVFRGTQHFYSMNSLDQIFWGLGAFTLVSLIRTGDRRFWILLGFVLGLGLLNKISILWLGTAIGVGLLLTPLRRCLATRWPWIALGIALLVFLPHLIWQAAWNFPTLEFVRNAKALKMVSHSPLEFLSNQILLMNAAAVPLFLAGLALWPVMREMRRWVILPVIFLTVLVILLASGSNKGYYLAAAYPFAIIPGAVVLERVLARGLWRGVGWLYAIVVVLAGLAVAPLAIPLLSQEEFIGYSRTLGLAPASEERSRPGELPQHFADMHGWEEMAANVAKVYATLSAEEQEKCVVFGQNYGQAAAIDVLGRTYGLPGAISGHNSYWLWGPGRYTGEVLIVIGGNREEMARMFRSVVQAGTTDAPYAMPYERNLPIYVCRSLSVPPAELWPRLRRYI